MTGAVGQLGVGETMSGMAHGERGASLTLNEMNRVDKLPNPEHLSVRFTTPVGRLLLLATVVTNTCVEAPVRHPGPAPYVAVLTYPQATVRAMWLHASPNWIEPDAWVLPPAARGTAPRTFPAGDAAEAIKAGWYDDNRVYIMWSDVDPFAHVGRFAFSRLDCYMYEVEPEGVGRDCDPLARPDWYSCSRAKVVRCVHTPEPIEVIDIDVPWP